MLDMRYTREDQAFPALVSAGTAIDDEGYALVVDKSEGNAYSVKLSTGSGDDFVGVSAYETRPPKRYPIIKEFDLPAEADVSDGEVIHTIIDSRYGAVISANATQDDSLSVWRNGIAAHFDDDGAANQYGIYIDGNDVKAQKTTLRTHVWFKADGDGFDANTKIRILAPYTPTLERQIALVGSHTDATPLSSGASVSCIRRGLIYTSAYDTALDQTYTVGDPVHTIAGGLFAKSGGVAVPGAFIAHVPTAEVPFLGIEFT